MKIKPTVFASLLAKLGHKVKAELVIDDATGVSLTFPDISEISEIIEGVSVSAPDGTYVIANGDDAITIEVTGGKVASVSTGEPAPMAAAEPGPTAEPTAALEVDAEELLTVMTNQIEALKANYAKVTADLADLKTSLKHDTTEGKPKPDAKGTLSNKFKILD